MDYNKLDLEIKNILTKIPKVIDEVEHLKIEQKTSYTDIVTEVDKRVEEFLTEEFLKIIPEAEILGEETFDPDYDYDMSKIFIIDPIDGTANFVKQNRDFCTIVSYFEDKKPILAYVYDIKRDIMYWAMADKGVFVEDKKVNAPENKSLKDALAACDVNRLYGTDLFEYICKNSFATRNLGSAGLEGVRVALGQTGVYANYRIGPWDFSPFFLMADILDLHISDLEGNPVNLLEPSSYMISTKKIAKELLY